MSLQPIDSHIVCKTVVNVETTLIANNTDAFHQIYINDMPSSVLSSIYLFADDANVYRNISSNDDPPTLQHDLQQLEKW